MSAALLVNPAYIPGTGPVDADYAALYEAAVQVADVQADSVFHVRFSSPPPRDTTLARIAHLCEQAIEEDVTPSRTSEVDLNSFLARYPGARDPEIYLLENGNFRVVWDTADGRQIAIQFLGDGIAQFVFFARREGYDGVSRSAGRDTIEGVVRQAKSLDLTRIFYL